MWYVPKLVWCLVQPIRVQPTKPDAPLVLLPMTFVPGQTGRYSITVYASKPVYIKGGESIQPAEDDGDHDDDDDIKALFCESVLESEDPGGHHSQPYVHNEASAAESVKTGGAQPQSPATPIHRGVSVDTGSLEEMANKQVAAAREQLKQAEEFMDFVRKLKSSRGVE